MSMEIKAIVLVVLVVVVAAMAVSYIKNFMGKAVRGVLHVPQGKNRVNITVTDADCLKPYKFAQVFEVLVSAEDAQLIHKNTAFGFTDPADSYSRALSQLAQKHKKVYVRTVVSSTDDKGQPQMQLLLPNTAWFVKALKARQN